jgi:4-hydroxy-tetrahydrodipicolinate synthase
MEKAPLRGLIAALPTPDGGGGPDLDALSRIVDLVLEAGVDGVCVAGATGEYPRLDRAARAAVVRHVAGRLPADRVLVSGIGAATARETKEAGVVARDAGSRALLLPGPYFFRYEAEDVETFCREVSEDLQTPCLLYNLPAFTAGFSTGSIVRLLESGGFLAGVKDSSGDRERLGAVAAARAGRPWTLLVGDDRLIREGWGAGWDGSVSGIAACCPELLVALSRALARGHGHEAARLQALVDEAGAELSVFPVPWGIRLALEARGYPTGPLPFPLSAERRRQGAAFMDWFRQFLTRLA